MIGATGAPGSGLAPPKSGLQLNDCRPGAAFGGWGQVEFVNLGMVREHLVQRFAQNTLAMTVNDSDAGTPT